MARINVVPVLLLLTPIYCRRLQDSTSLAPPHRSGELEQSDGPFSVELDRTDNELDSANRYALLPFPNTVLPINDPLIFSRASSILAQPLLNPGAVENSFHSDKGLLNIKPRNQVKKIHSDKGKWPTKKHLIELIPLRKKTKLNKALAYILPNTESKKLIQRFSAESNELVPDVSLTSEEDLNDSSELNYSNELSDSDSSSSDWVTSEYKDHDPELKHFQGHQLDSVNKNNYIKNKKSGINIKYKIKKILADLTKHNNNHISQLIRQMFLDTIEDSDLDHVDHKNTRLNKNRINHYINGYNQGSVNHHKFNNDNEKNQSDESVENLAEELLDNKHRQIDKIGKSEKSFIQDLHNHDSQGLLHSLLEVINEKESHDLLSHIQPQLKDLLDIIHQHKDPKSPYYSDTDKDPNTPHIHHIEDSNSQRLFLYENPNSLNVQEIKPEAEHIHDIEELEDSKPHIIKIEPNIASYRNVIKDNDNLITEDPKHHQIKENDNIAGLDINDDFFLINIDPKHHHNSKEIEHNKDHAINDLIDNSNSDTLIRNSHNEFMKPNESNKLNIIRDVTTETTQASQDSLLYNGLNSDIDDENDSESSISDSISTSISDDHSEESADHSDVDVSESHEDPEGSALSENKSGSETNDLSYLYPDDDTKTSKVINISDLYNSAQTEEDILPAIHVHDFDDSSYLDFPNKKDSDEVLDDADSDEINLYSGITHDDLTKADCCKNNKQGTHSDDCAGHKSYKLTFLFNK